MKGAVGSVSFHRKVVLSRFWGCGGEFVSSIKFYLGFYFTDVWADCERFKKSLIVTLLLRLALDYFRE